MAARIYLVGVPLAISVDDRGFVTFDVDLSEVTDFTENVEDGAYPDEVVDSDVLTVEAAAATLGNHYALPVIPPSA